MSRPSRLGSLLRLRAIAERQAQGRVAQAEAGVLSAVRQVAQRRDAAGNRPPRPAALSPTRLRALELQGVRALELVEEALAVQERAEQRRAEAARDLASASVRHRSTQRIVERRQAEAAFAARVAAERALDELVLLRRRAEVAR